MKLLVIATTLILGSASIVSTEDAKAHETSNAQNELLEISNTNSELFEKKDMTIAVVIEESEKTSAETCDSLKCWDVIVDSMRNSSSRN